MIPAGRAPAMPGTALTRLAISACVAMVVVLVAGCGGKESRKDSGGAGPPERTGRPDSVAAAEARNAPGRTGSEPSPGSATSYDATTTDLHAAAKRYGYDQAGEYVRDLIERTERSGRRLDDIDRRIRATEAPESAEMDARLVTLRAIAEDIRERGMDAQYQATERDWTAWQVSLEREFANLERGITRLDSLVAAVRGSP